MHIVQGQQCSSGAEGKGDKQNKPQGDAVGSNRCVGFVHTILTSFMRVVLNNKVELIRCMPSRQLQCVSCDDKSCPPWPSFPPSEIECCCTVSVTQP